MFQLLVKRYIIVFVLTISGYSLLDWYVYTHLHPHIDVDYLYFWIPVVICYVISFALFKPIVKQLPYKDKRKDGIVWALIPFTLWMPIAFSQGYFIDSSYGLITVDKPSELIHYPHERFFKVKSFLVLPNNHSVIRERHTSGRGGSTLNVSAYYLAPMFDDPSQTDRYQPICVGYGVKFTTSMGNGLLVDKNKQQRKIERFVERSEQDYANYDFQHADFFEKSENSKDANYYLQASHHNTMFYNEDDKTFILEGKTGTINDLYKRDRNLFVYPTFICFGLGVGLLFLVNRLGRDDRKYAFMKEE